MAAPLTRLQRLTYRVWLAVGILVLAAVSFTVVIRPLGVILAPAVVALLLVYLLNPAVAALARLRVPRLLGTLLTYVVVGAILGGLGVVLVPLLNAQLTSFAAEAPDLGITLTERLGELIAAVGLDVDVPALFDTQVVGEQVGEFVAAEENRGTVTAVLAALSGFARSAFTVAFALTVGPVVAFYVLADLPNLLTTLRRLFPPERRQEVEDVGVELATVVGGFVRGQLIIAVAIGVATSIALGVVGLPYWLVIGTIAGITNLIPLLGPFIAGVLGVTVALVSEGLGFALLVLVLMTAVQQLDSSVLSPLIMGRVVHVHPLAVLLGVLTAAALYGVFGMLVVVPLIAGVKVLAQHLWRTRVPWAEDPEAHDPPTAGATAAEATTAGTTADRATAEGAAADDAPTGPHPPARSGS